MGDEEVEGFAVIVIYCMCDEALAGVSAWDFV